MNGATILSRPVLGAVTDLNWGIAGVGDFDGDGKSDVLWHNSTTGSNSIWLMNGATISGGATAFATVADLNWSIAGVGDFDGDGKSDILWHNSTTGSNSIWLMNGTTISGGATAFATVADLNRGIAGVGDFDGDGKSDVLWRNRATGEISIWLMNGATIAYSAAIGSVADLNWLITLH
jgi:hypothetical protein